MPKERSFRLHGKSISLQPPTARPYAHRYNAPFAARAYVKIGSSRYYGSCRTASLAAAAQRIKQTGGDAYTQHQAYIDNILAQADAVPEA